MASAECPHRVAAPMVTQRWRSVTFVHWKVHASKIEPLIPEPLALDMFDAGAWVTLTPFSTTSATLGMSLPGPKRYPETNLRTYVRAPDGSDGLWFFSLDVTNKINVVLGRAMGLPYHQSDMSSETSNTVRYRGERRDSSASYEIETVPGALKVRDPLDVFLTGRWSAFVGHHRRIWRHDVEHSPWPTHHAEIVTCRETLRAAAGVDTPKDHTVVHYSPGVNARLSAPRLIGNARFPPP
jgi:uncharacterized protein YqjF (DUF2071 family)